VRGLFGDLSVMPLQDLVVYLSNRQASGLLRLERDPVKKQVLLKSGAVVNASSNEPREYLGQFLINLGKITEEQFTKAYQTQQETKIFLGQILVMIGAVDETTVRNTLALKTRETLLEVYEWKGGTFSYEPDAETKLPQGIELAIPLADIHKEGEFRQTVWEAIRTVFPRGTCTLKLDRTALAEPPKPGSLDEKLYAMIENGHTIDEMTLALHATDFFLYQRLYALHRLEAITVANPDGALELDMAPFTVGTEADGKEVLEAAKGFLAQGNHRDALDAARKAAEMLKIDEASALVRDVEAGWLPSLQKLLPKERVPTLNVAPSKLKGMNLSAPERYLLSRVDGRRTVGLMVSVSPLRELDALAHLSRFLELGLIRLD